MAIQLLSNLGKKGDTSFTTTGIRKGLDTISVDIEDTAHLSTYFRVVEFNPVFTAGKNSISFNGSSLLANGSEIKVEILDSAGNSLYLTSPPRQANFVDIANFTVVAYVFQEIADGAGQIFLVGTTTDGEVVRWTGNITINTTYKNVSRVRFYFPPEISPLPLLLPAIDVTKGGLLGTNVVITGSCTGKSVAINPVTYTTFIGGGQNTPTLANTLQSDYRMDWTSFSASLGTVQGFNTEMLGANITLYVTKAANPTKPGFDMLNSTQSFTIKKVISPSEIQLSGDVVDTANRNISSYVSPNFVGEFFLSYTQTNYLDQATSIPCVGTYNPVSHSTVLITNEAFFSGSMVGKLIRVNYDTLFLTLSGSNTFGFNPSVSSSLNIIPVTASNYKVLSITDPYTASISPVNYTLYSYDSFGHPTATTYTASNMYGSVTSLTASSNYQYFTTIFSSSVLLQKSYLNIFYRNINTFSGFIARQKLYAKSNIYPGDFELISDTPVGPGELLFDPITINKNYADIGTFYNQDQVNTYWYASSASLQLVQSDVPVLSAMTITANPNYTAADGNSYVIAKVTSIGVNNDNVYYPFDAASYSDFTGTGYTSNFIFMASGVQYALESNITVNKNPKIAAKIYFYLTSSSPLISQEPNFSPTFGVKIGEIDIPDNVPVRTFTNVQRLYFTPLNDYHGTLVIVPYQCNVTLTNLSLTNYGDYGFSPGGASVQIPFPINVANESFTIKAELYDTNANLVYSIAPVVQSFDPNGVSLYGTSIIATNGTGSSTSYATNAISFTVANNLFLPGLTELPPQVRYLVYQPPLHNPPFAGEGEVGFTPVSNINLVPTVPTLNTVDYLNIELNGTTVGRSIALRYSGSNPSVYGRRVYVDPTGSKTTYL